MDEAPALAQNGRPCVRIAAAGDIHADGEGDRERIQAAFTALHGNADLLLLAGDLTTHGEPEEARPLAAACADLAIPVVAVLGNHDHHAGRADDVVATLADAGVTVLERDHALIETERGHVGVVGTKGFIGGFPGSHLPDFGEPLLRQCYAETTADVAAIDHGLRELAMCPIRVVLLHYAPTHKTLAGEPEGIWTMLGNDRLAAPIREHEPDLALHGHAHAGRFDSHIGNTPVYNVSVHVMGRDFWVFEIAGAAQPAARLH
jgi:Icc-related predicted phosphoesterase